MIVSVPVKSLVKDVLLDAVSETVDERDVVLVREAVEDAVVVPDAVSELESDDEKELDGVGGGVMVAVVVWLSDDDTMPVADSVTVVEMLRIVEPVNTADTVAGIASVAVG